MGYVEGMVKMFAIVVSVPVLICVWSWLPSMSAPWNDFDMPLDSMPLSSSGISSCNSCGGAQAPPELDVDGNVVTTSARIAAAISGALAADAFAIGTHRSYDVDAIREACGGQVPQDLRTALSGGGEKQKRVKVAGQQSECGDEMLHTMSVLAAHGFNFKQWAGAWQVWAENYGGHLNVGAQEALRNLASGMPANASGSHFIDLMGAVRVPALILLAEQIDDNGLALASREMQAVSHENPMALQAGDFLLRAALKLLRGQLYPRTPERRRAAVAFALHAAADSAGSQFHAVIDDAVSEAQSRDNRLRLTAAEMTNDGARRDAFAATRDDMEVIGRLTASGDQLGQEVQGGKTSFIIPAIIWLVLAYDTFSDAVVANFLLGGESAVRAMFVGLLLAARDGPGSVPQEWMDQLLAQPDVRVKVPAFVMPFYLCKVPGACHVGEGWTGERSMHHVTTAAAVLHLPARGDFYAYRIFIRIDAAELLRKHVRPSDWDDSEDGPWEPPDDGVQSGQVECLARYFQFTSSSGRHAPFGVWPAQALCRLSQDVPVAHESFDLVLPERLRDLIGGVVIGSKGRIVKLPALAVHRNAKAPRWEKRCDHVGTLRLPEGKWLVEDAAKL